MWTVAKLSFKEILYKRIFLITVLMSLAFLVFYGIATYYAGGKIAEGLGSRAADPDAILQRQFFSSQFLGIGLYMASIIASLLAILSSVGAIAGEIESHQMDTLLARPLHRRSVVLGKFIGLGGLLALYAACLFTGIICINRWLGGDVLQASVSFGQACKAGGFFVLQPLLLVSVALLFSSTMSTINGGVILIILYGIGFVGGFIEQIGGLLDNRPLVNIGIVSSLVFPLDSLFRHMTITLFDTADDPISFASQGIFGSVSAPSGLMLAYIVCYGIAALLLALRKFERRDI